MGAENVLIVGAGAAGLMAARDASALPRWAGGKVAILEARDRVGGRIHTIYPEASSVPVELGAEFIHGDRNLTWEIAAAWDELETTEVPDRHWEFRDGQLQENARFWEEMECVMGKLGERRWDESFESVMRGITGVPARVRRLARDYVEGFHAAQPKEIGVLALAEAEEASARSRGQRQFHLTNGYTTVVEHLARRLTESGVRIHFGCVVDTIRWRPGKVEIAAGGGRYAGGAAIITVPIGVLQQKGVKFEPALPEKDRAAASLRMGDIVKLTLAFDRRIWPAEVSGFIHAHGAAFPTWWIDERAPVITGWAGGPAADTLSDKSDEGMVRIIVRELGKIFEMPPKAVAGAIRGSFRHDWRRDPFARGAYSYIPAGQHGAVECLAEPVENTLFFAGEALAPAGEHGTVHGAFASGMRVAREVAGRA